MRVVTNEDIKTMNRLYLELKTYAAVARKTGFSPATVKKYIQPDFTPIEEKDIKRFNEPLPDFDPSMFRCDDWGHLCVLSDEEVVEIRELWKEIEL